MLFHSGFNAVERVIRRPCALFLRHCLIPIPTVTRGNIRNVESVDSKQIMKQDKSILEKVVVKDSQTITDKGIFTEILIKRYLLVTLKLNYEI